MTGKNRHRNPVAVSDVASDILDPVLRRRAGISVGLVQSWEEIVGPRLAPFTRPEKIQWPRRVDDDDPFKPAVLVIACEGFAALHVQHETSEIMSRINAFLGFPAVGNIRIVQKPVDRGPQKPRRNLRQLSDVEEKRIAGWVAGIEDEGLRASLERLGKSIFGAK